MEIFEAGADYSVKGYKFDDGSGEILRCAVEVHKTLGPGFQEVVYQRALAFELEAAGLDFSREVETPIFYKGKQIAVRRVDFVVKMVIVELKAKAEFDPQDFVQALNYIKASNFKLGLLLNFGAARLQIKRLVN